MAMGFLKNLFGTEDENEGFYDYDEEESSVDTSSNAVTNEEAAYSSSSYGEPKSYSESKSYSSTNSSGSKFVNIGTGSSGTANIKILKPGSYEDVLNVTVDLIREGTAIFVCLNGLPNDVCIRIVDFLTGVTAALYGGVEKVDSYCYLARPRNFNLIGSID